MTWERKLHDEAIDAVVMVQLVDATQKFCLGDVVFIANQAGLEAASLAGQDFIADVGLRTAVVADENGCQMGTTLAVRHHFLYL